MTTVEISALFIAALLAGVINAVAGGGSFISFPALLFFNVPSMAANATNAVATWPGMMSSAWSYRKVLLKHRKGMLLIAVISMIGGASGALLVMHTPKAFFTLATPVFILIAFLFFAFGPALAKRKQNRPVTSPATTATEALCTEKRTLLQLVASCYAGYFPSGGGMVLMALYNSFGIKDAQFINALKCMLGVTVSGAAVLTFVLSGQVYWPQAWIMIAGSLAGGFAGAQMAQRLNPVLLRQTMLILGGSITVYFFHKYYGPMVLS